MKIILLLLFSLTLLVSNEPIEYGWDIPHTPLRVGGYVDAVYDEKAEDAFIFDDVSLLFSANENHWSFLSEVELSSLNLDGKSNGTADIRLNLERLQFTYALDETDQIRVGRFNSDIGFWNQAPINILQETTTMPHMARYLYPRATTGISYIKQFNDEDRLTLTLQDNGDIGQEDFDFVADQHFALSYHGVSDDLSWSLSGGLYREEELQNRAVYAGVGLEYELERVLIQSELFTQHSDDGKSKPYSAYVQSSWNFASKQNAVVRLEAYDDEVLNTKELVSLVGYVYRPFACMALKGEYIDHTSLPLDRFVFSFSVMF